MPASKRPRKAHRPRIIARPVFESMRRELMIPAHAALRVLERVSDPEALEGARHTLAACLSYMAAALDGAGYEIGPIGAGRELMDDELCEQIHGTVDSEQEFADDYCAAHRAKYGSDFVVG